MDQYQRAILKARTLGGPGSLIAGVRDGVYSVCGSVAPATYTVMVDPQGDVVCDCAGGRNDLFCYHSAVVRMHRLALRRSRKAILASATHAGGSLSLTSAERESVLLALEAGLGLRRGQIDG